MSVFRLTFLGTSAAQPTARRNLSATALRVHGDHILLDCGEGTQRQMLRYGTGFATGLVLFTHFHADHYLGIIGHLRTLAMNGREAPLTLHGPGPTLQSLLARLIHLGFRNMPFPLELETLEDGQVLDRGAYTIQAVRMLHRTPTLGYVFREPPRPGRFDPTAARELGVPEGPLFGRLQKGETITLPDGRQIEPGQVLGPSRPGRKVAFSGDTGPCDAFAEAAAGADLIVHESTFGDSELMRAKETTHSTARQAGEIAARAGARQLVLTHFSSRYDHTPELLRDQAAEVFGGEIVCAHDGLTIEVPYRA
ncbi:MAG: ribonuclease Z [Deltaproteobacteria bacterium]|nr:ribonuclease Z [Deltaproteobacteria bacterium]